MTPQDASGLYATWAGGDGKQRKKEFNNHVAVDVSEVESIQHFEFSGPDNSNNNEDEARVLVLTPMINDVTEETLAEYFKRLSELHYSHDRIDLGILVPAGEHHTSLRKAVRAAADALQAGKRGFRSVQLVTKSLDSDDDNRSGSGCRESYDAKARNYLVAATLLPRHGYVFWHDVNLVDAPAMLIEDLMRADADLVFPNTWDKAAVSEASGRERGDYRAWTESPAGYKLALGLPKDTVIPAGDRDRTHETGRTYLAAQGQNVLAAIKAKEDKKNGGSNNKDDVNEQELHAQVPLDAVGTAALLVRADVHRTGIIFPWFAFENQCGSEGFGKMARRAGYRVVGLPNYVVYTEGGH
ncbi:hypothetical protein D0Z00_001656 [Geotrichum galactomycetum]|uniref:Uncharacterized protein n=1 Tax=Geotrichum galactomycetum TaxID=27317 RepID=A0ACB6V698_9ASCO|nr:hypothetical protein D0Z00_001656 [Geotrichum candidum]